MRSASLFAVAVLTVILAVSLFSPVAALGGITIKKITTNGDTTTQFEFAVSGASSAGFVLVGGGVYFTGATPAGDYTVVETVPPGWVLTNVYCEGFINVGTTSSFTYIPGEGVTIHYVDGDLVTCGFTNSPAAPVGGLVMPANNLAIATPWLAIIGLIGCIGTVALVTKKRRQ